MSQFVKVGVIFDSDGTVYYPLNVAELPIYEEVNFTKAQPLSTVTMQFAEQDINADALLSHDEVAIYYFSEETTLIWSGHIVKSSIFTKNSVVSVTFYSKAAEFLNEKVSFTGDYKELIKLIQDKLDESGVSYDWNYTAPELKGNYQLIGGVKYGEESDTEFDINDAIAYAVYPAGGGLASGFLLISTNKKIIKADISEDSLSFKTIATTTKRFGKFVRDVDSNIDKIVVEEIDDTYSTGTLSTRFDYIANLVYITGITTGNIKIYKAFFGTNDTDYTSIRNLSNYRSDKSYYILSHSAVFYKTNPGYEYVLARAHFISTEVANWANEIDLGKMVFHYFSDHDAYAAYIMESHVLDSDGSYLIPCTINGKMLYYNYKDDCWGDVDYENWTFTHDIGYSPIDSIASVVYFRKIDGDWYFRDKNGNNYKIYIDGQWKVESVENPFGYTDFTFRDVVGYDNFKIKLGNWELTLTNYKGILYIYQKANTLATRPHLYIKQTNMNLLDLLVSAMIPLGLVFRYNGDTGKYEFFNIDTTNDWHSIDINKVDPTTVVRKEYIDDYAADLLIKNDIREISHTQTGVKRTVISDIIGDWESYLDNILNYVSVKRPQYEMWISGIYLWKIWDSVIYNMEQYWLAGIKIDFVNKRTWVKLVHANYGL